MSKAKVVEKKDKIKVHEAEIVVHGTAKKPYFEIKYREVGKEEYNIGYSSYDLGNVFGWLKSEFDIVDKREKRDYSAHCNLNDEDEANDCWGCTRFLFPIGCMVGEDDPIEECVPEEEVNWECEEEPGRGTDSES